MSKIYCAFFAIACLFCLALGVGLGLVGFWLLEARAQQIQQIEEARQ